MQKQMSKFFQMVKSVHEAPFFKASFIIFLY